MNRNSKRVTALAVGTVAVMGTGIAFAAWTATGNGTGAAKAYTMFVSANTPTDPTGTANLLYPGQTAGAVNVSLTNNNPFAVHVDSITQQTSGSPATPVAITVASPGKGTCTSNAVTFTEPTLAAINTAVGNAGVINAGDTVSFNLSTVGMGASDDGCQGASFSVPLTVTETQTSPHL